MNLQKIVKIDEKLEKWADQKIPDLVPGPKLAVMVSLNMLVGDHLNEFVKCLRLADKTEWAKIVKEDYEMLEEAAIQATSDLVKRVVEFKIDRLDKQHNEVSALDILDPNFKMPTDHPWDENEIPRTVYFDKCAQCARQLARTLRQVVVMNRDELKNKEKPKLWLIGCLFEKTSNLIGAIIVAIIGGLIVAILIDIFGDFGWIERIKSVIYKILQLN